MLQSTELLQKYKSNQLIVNVQKHEVALELVDTFDPSLRDVELISVGLRRSNFGFSRVKKIKHSRATVYFFEEESIQKNKSKPNSYYFHVPKLVRNGKGIKKNYP